MNLRIECEHRWRYFVDVKSGSVNVRRCERCGVEGAMGSRREAAVVVEAAALVERISA